MVLIIVLLNGCKKEIMTHEVLTAFSVDKMQFAAAGAFSVMLSVRKGKTMLTHPSLQFSF